MTSAGAQIAGSTAAQDAARDWQAVHGDADIQYAPLPPYTEPQREPPEWLLRFLRWLGSVLESVFRPLGDLFGLSWPVMKVVAMGVAAVALIAMLWFLVIRPLLGLRRKATDHAVPEWQPDREAAVALLEDADRLAAEGRFAEAVHLLLQRSVHHIAEARPDWLSPASTAREIAGLPMLPGDARRAFATIATRVERSLFALRALDRGDWQAAREAYAAFALQRLGAVGAA